MLLSASGVFARLGAWQQHLPTATVTYLQGCLSPGALQSWVQCSSAAATADAGSGDTTSSSGSSAQQARGWPMDEPAPSGRPEHTTAAPAQHSPSSPPARPQPPQPTPMSYGPRLVQPLRGRGAGAVTKQEGIVHVNNSLNNTILVLTDKAGTVKTWTSAGSVGYKNAGKASPIATEAAAAELARRAVASGFYSVVVKLNGAGQNKQFAVQSLAANGLHVTQLQEVTAVPHNGCRKPRRRRV